MLVFLLFIGFVQYVSPESCFHQRCLSCPSFNEYIPGQPVECGPANWVSSQWIHNLGHPPPSTDSKVPIEYRCLKMVATPDDKSFGHTVDVLRGCVPRAQVDSVCSSLAALERARGHSDARCFICRGNNCNGSTIIQLSATVTLFSIFSYFLK